MAFVKQNTQQKNTPIKNQKNFVEEFIFDGFNLVVVVDGKELTKNGMAESKIVMVKRP